MGVEALRVALGALVGHRFRTVLTMLSIVIGAFAIVLMVSLAQSGLATLQHGMEELGGSRVILIGSRPSEKQVGKQGTYPTGFTLHEYQSLTRAVPHLTEHTIFYVGRDYVDAQSDTGAVARTDLVAGDSHFFDAFRLPVAEGRGIGDADDKGHAPVCVVSPKVAEALFRGSPVGHMLTVGTVRCRVVGRLAKVERWGVGFGWDWDDLVVVPLETVADAVPEVHSSATLFFKTDDKANNDAVKRILHARLGDLHHGLDDYLIFDFAKGLARFESMFLLMQALVGVVSGIALLVGGVGVMNMLLVSVTERVGPATSGSSSSSRRCSSRASAASRGRSSASAPRRAPSRSCGAWPRAGRGSSPSARRWPPFWCRCSSARASATCRHGARRASIPSPA